jgi:hypothetical protein
MLGRSDDKTKCIGAEGRVRAREDHPTARNLGLRKLEAVTKGTGYVADAPGSWQDEELSFTIAAEQSSNVERKLQKPRAGSGKWKSELIAGSSR